MNHSITFKQFRFLFHTLNILFSLFIFICLILFLKNTYHLFITEHHLLKYSTVDLFSKNIQLIEDVVFFWLKEHLLRFIISIFIISMIQYIFNRLSMYKTIQYWYDNKEFSTIFSRIIASHFRYHKKIQFKEIIHLYSYSKKEMALVQYHYKKQIIMPFLKDNDYYMNDDISKN